MYIIICSLFVFIVRALDLNITFFFSQHIDKTYGRIPSLYEADTTLIPKLRNAALLAIDRSRKQHGPPEESLTITPLKQYYAHLVQLTNKFPEILQHSSKETQQLSKAEKERLKGPDLIFAW